MIRASNHQHFESARILQRQIASLSHIRDVALIKGEYDSTGGTHSIRIEAYDVAHTGGSETVGVMVVSESGEMLKAEYRSFNIKTATNDDSASLTELLSRRLRHAEWALPGLIVLDGGMAQMHAAQQVLKLNNMNIPLVGVVKDTRHKPDHLIGDADMIKQYEKDILALNAEAHRYAITKHRARLRKALINIVH
jgi:excinuclease ABC subunit C